MGNEHLSSVGDPLETPLADFRVFLKLCWNHLGLPDPTPRQYEIAHFLQHGPRRSIIQAFRGVGKSWITSAYVCWRLLLDPTINILVVSGSRTRADDFSSFTFRLIYEIPVLQHLKPNIGGRNSRVSFDVGPAPASHSPSVKSLGVTSQLAGSRADLIIPDDVETPGNAWSELQREQLGERVKEFDAILKPNGEIKYLGTPQTEDSLYVALRERGYHTLIWPARFPKPSWMEANGRMLAPKVAMELEEDPDLVDTPCDPQRFDEDDLEERELSYGKHGFALQFMLDTSLSDADLYPLKCRDLVVMDFPGTNEFPEKILWTNDSSRVWRDLPCIGLRGDRFYQPIQPTTGMSFKEPSGCVMFIDPSGRGKDETGVAIVKMLNGQLFVSHCNGFRDGYSPTVLEKLARLAKQHKVNLIQIESNFGDGMFAQLLKPVLERVYPCTVEDVRNNTMKEVRIIDTLEPVMATHRLVVSKEVVEKDSELVAGLPLEEARRYQLFYQLSRITRQRNSIKHDDRLDSLAGAVRYWLDYMSVDAERVIANERRHRLAKEIEDYRDNLDSLRFPNQSRSPETFFSNLIS